MSPININTNAFEIMKYMLTYFVFNLNYCLHSVSTKSCLPKTPEHALLPENIKENTTTFTQQLEDTTKLN